MRVNALGSCIGALGFRLHDAVGNGLARLAQYQHDVDGGTGSRAHQHQFHRPRAEIAAAVRGRAVDDNGMAAAGFSHEAHLLRPFDPCFHWYGRVCEWLLLAKFTIYNPIYARNMLQRN